MDVDEPCDEVQLVLPKAECTSKRRVLRTLDIQYLQQVTYAMSTTTPFAVIVDNAVFQTKGCIVGWLKHVLNGREERETAREGTREPVKQNSQGPGPQNP